MLDGDRARVFVHVDEDRRGCPSPLSPGAPPVQAHRGEVVRMDNEGAPTRS